MKLANVTKSELKRKFSNGCIFVIFARLNTKRQYGEVRNGDVRVARCTFGFHDPF